MPSHCLLDLIDTIVDAYITTIIDDDERGEALTFHRGLMSLIATSTSGSGKVASSMCVGGDVSERRLETAIAEARTQQIINAFECIRSKVSKAVRSMRELTDNASRADHRGIISRQTGVVNMLTEDVANAELSSEMSDVETSLAQLKGALALATGHYTTVTASDMDAAVSAGYANPAVISVLIDELARMADISLDQAWAKGFNKGWESRSELQSSGVV